MMKCGKCGDNNSCDECKSNINDINPIDMYAIEREFFHAFRGKTKGTMNQTTRKKIKNALSHLNSMGMFSNPKQTSNYWEQLPDFGKK